MRHLQEYCRPSTAAEAVRLKSEAGDEAVYLAGGTDLLVHKPSTVVRAIDIRHAGIDFTGRTEDGYTIGGATLLREAEEAMAPVAGGMLRSALRETAPWLIRNAATVAGNIANASPAADSVPALMVLDAELSLSEIGKPLVPLHSILVGPHRTSLGNRLIHDIRISNGAAERSGAFIKLARSKSDIALVNVAVAFRRDGDRIRDVRVALGAVAPTAVRGFAVERLLEGETPSEDAVAAAAESVQNDISPISDWRASADYRRRMSSVLVRRAFYQALQQRGEELSHER